MTCAIDFGSICSGIEAASVAWECLGFEARWFAEIEPFPSAVLAHRWPAVPNLGDMTKLAREVLQGIIAAPLILVGGTPCQDFSVAGMRKGLAGERGALTIKFVELADAIDHVRPAGDECVVVWENVPGVLSDKGNAFGCFLGALVGESDALQPTGRKWTNAGCVYGPRRAAAWRVLDAQYFGLAQRRRRVFVVASARNGFDPAAVLFESGGVRRDTAPSRGARQEAAGSASHGTQGRCGNPRQQEEGRPSPKAFGGGKNCNPTDVSTAITAHPGGRYDLDAETFVVAATLTSAHAKNGGIPAGNDCTPANLIVGALTASSYNGGAGGRPEGAAAGHFIVAGTLNANAKAAGSATQQDAESGLLVVHGTQDPCIQHNQAHTLGRNNGQENAVFAIQATALRTNPTSGPDGVGVQAEHAYTLEARAEVQAVNAAAAVRRLTPRECERLQGFPDDYTLIPWRGKPAEECPDGPRYKAIGNSKAIPVVRWIGRRLKQHLAATAQTRAAA
ncbi:DNA cytosine methyltransferase [Pseudomonas sp. 1D4]|uniref:DNA cytosine methyltransferase n=1 Tax=Pseudomonas sp. 1D4 TaxID=1843691 RepID=UPI0009F1AB56|nr:DNA cytosine methyltransferase [Pseudomonas sp. 1D4]